MAQAQAQAPAIAWKYSSTTVLWYCGISVSLCFYLCLPEKVGWEWLKWLCVSSDLTWYVMPLYTHECSELSEMLLCFHQLYTQRSNCQVMWSIFNLHVNLHSVIHSLPSHQQCALGSFSPHPHQCLWPPLLSRQYNGSTFSCMVTLILSSVLSVFVLNREKGRDICGTVGGDLGLDPMSLYTQPGVPLLSPLVMCLLIAAFFVS